MEVMLFTRLSLRALRERVREALCKCKVYDDDIEWMTEIILNAIYGEAEDEIKVGGTD